MSDVVRTRPPRTRAPLSWPDAAAVVLLLVPGVVSFGPVFGGPQGWIAAGGGALLGCAIGVWARRFGWSSTGVVGAVLGVYLLFGGALALPRTTIAGVIPTLDTLLRLLPLTVQAWQDLLTVSLPASNFTGPAVVPLATGLLAGVGAMLLAHTRRWSPAAVLPPLALLVVGILWGTREAPLAGALGAAYAVVALGWLAWRAAAARAQASDAVLASARAAGAARRVGGGAAIVVAAAVIALVAQPLVASGANRHVLRDNVDPPLNLQDYASPLTQYRYLEVDAKDETIFTVSGLPDDARLRLATLDAYDGNVYGVSGRSAGFVRIGEVLDGNSPRGEPATLEVTSNGYAGVWVAGAGDLRGIQFRGPSADAQLQGLYYSTFDGTVLTTAGVVQGDRWTMQVTVAPVVADDPGARVSDLPAPAPSRVPEVVGTLAQEFVGDASTPLGQLRRIEEKLSTTGFYSNGADGTSRAGHNAERIGAMLSAPMIIGDDEQYSVAMALMARHLGIPARVVLGFYPEPDEASANGPVELKGAHAHAWVEVPFDGLGWVAFDPTPDRDQVPQTQVRQPKPDPKPQVLPPPDPPLDPFDGLPDALVTQDREPDNAFGDLLWRILRIVAVVIGWLAVLTAPFAAIWALKARRRRARLGEARPADRVSGAWAEVADTAADLGTRVSPMCTRREAAHLIQQAYPSAPVVALAAAVDAEVFGPRPASDASASRLWEEGQEVALSMRGCVPRWRRIAGSFSLRSFGLTTSGLWSGARATVGALRARIVRKESA